MLSPALIEALAIAGLPDVQWQHDDDLCDCVFQRIGMWKNPYLATQHEIRLCCVWAELEKQYPDFVRTIPGYFNENTKEWQTEPSEWNAEFPMPKAIWYRHLARQQGRSVADIRAEYAGKDELRPRGVPRPAVETEPAIDATEAVFAMLSHLADRIVALEGRE